MKTETILLLIGAYLLYQWYQNQNPQPGNPNFVGPVNTPGYVYPQGTVQLGPVLFRY